MTARTYEAAIRLMQVSIDVIAAGYLPYPLLERLGIARRDLEAAVREEMGGRLTDSQEGVKSRFSILEIE